VIGVDMLDDATVQLVVELASKQERNLSLQYYKVVALCSSLGDGGHLKRCSRKPHLSS